MWHLCLHTVKSILFQLGPYSACHSSHQEATNFITGWPRMRPTESRMLKEEKLTSFGAMLVECEQPF